MSNETDLIAKWDERIVTLGNKLAEMAEKHGPDVADAALAIGRIDAASGLVGSAIGACVCGGLVYALSRLRKHFAGLPVGKAGLYTSDSNEFARTFGSFAAAGSMGVVAFIGALFASGLFNLWRWVGVFEPQLWLAKKALGL